MKSLKGVLTRSLLISNLLSGSALTLAAQPVSPYGPANPITNTVTFPPGWSLIANPLFHCRGEIVMDAVPDNSLGELFQRVSEGTVLVKFDNTTQQFLPRNVFRRGHWSNPSERLAPGEGAFLFNPGGRQMDFTFTGNVSYDGVSVPVGLSLISSPGLDFVAAPTLPGPGMWVGVHFDPQEGDMVYTLASGRGGFVRHRFRNGTWDILPVLGEAESCFAVTSHPRLIYLIGPRPLLPGS